MERHLFQSLMAWKTRPSRMPLLLRGARQVGKSYLVNAFGQAQFDEVISINFERNPEYSDCFKHFEVKEILQKISVYQGKSIVPGKTLLFLDEIQACPRAIEALRYFKEEYPELHVIGAGSLLEFALRKEDVKMPVGRVEFLYLKPLSFMEYLDAIGKTMWREAISNATLSEPLPSLLHTALLKEVKKYMMLGGMPAVLNQALDHDAGETLFHPMQMDILSSYQNDFWKYASSNTQQEHLYNIFQQMPHLIGQQTKYHKINPDVHSRFLKAAISCLSWAGVVYPVYATHAAGLPVNAGLNYSKYKLFFLDVGLITAKSNLSAAVLMSEDILLINRGALAEQLVCQELLAYQAPYQEAQVQYWSREEKSSQAEVDFVIQHENRILPIEVKAGNTGRLRSLQLMMKEKQLELGVRISELPLQWDANTHILSLPFYMISEIGRLTEKII